jgi:hypothetical protein
MEIIMEPWARFGHRVRGISLTAPRKRDMSKFENHLIPSKGVSPRKLFAPPPKNPGTLPWYQRWYSITALIKYFLKNSVFCIGDRIPFYRQGRRG